MEGVQKLLSNLNVTKASGPDNISCKILCELSTELAPVLCSIFQQSIHTGQIPHDWTTAFVTPIFKKGNHHLAGNYRPVSLTSVPCKILEHIICSHIRSHLDKHNILTQWQHGFRSKHSCETQLLITLHDLLHWRDQKVQVDMVVLDFAKAFDTVPHRSLLGKLQHYGIDDDILNWVSAFLTCRTQSVVVDGQTSNSASVDSGVPQGTVLGPLLFLLHINDLPQSVQSTVRLFADDCLLYRPIKSVQDTITLQKDLLALEQWGDRWGIKFHADKCNIIRLSRTRNPITKMYSLVGQVLKEVDQAKYLGITISSELDWSPHISNISAKANNTLAFLRRNLKYCPRQLKENAYISLVRSQLEYSASIWDPYRVGDSNQLDRVQRRAAKFVFSDYSYHSSVTDMIHKLGWKDLATRRKELRLTLLYKMVHGLVAVPASDYLTPADKRTRALHPFKYRSVPCSTDSFKFSCIPRTIPDWNSLPRTTVEAPSIDSFKSRLSPGSGPSTGLSSRRAASTTLATCT